MIHEPELTQIGPGLFVWQRYDPAVKAELFSTALITSGVWLIDPIPIQPAALEPVLAISKIAGVIVTNTNHERASGEFAERFGVFIYGGSQAPPNDEIRLIKIEGAAPDEIAIHSARDGGTLVMGDALIHMSSEGFTFLPTKYCTNHKLMRKSLRQLLDLPFERILFAHGLPIVSQARTRLENLLNAGS